MANEDRQLWQIRERDCRIQRRSYEMSLQALSPVRWTMVGGGTVLSLAAGTALLTSPGAGPTFHTIAGLCALASGILTGLHSVLKCEEYQTECHRLATTFHGLEFGFQALNLKPEDQRHNALADLEAKYEIAVSTAKVRAFARFLRKARLENPD